MIFDSAPEFEKESETLSQTLGQNQISSVRLKKRGSATKPSNHIEKSTSLLVCPQSSEAISIIILQS